MSQVKVSAEAKLVMRDLYIAREFADSHEHFNDAFLQSLELQYADKKYITDNQYSALKRVIEGWNMLEWAEENDV